MGFRGNSLKCHHMVLWIEQTTAETILFFKEGQRLPELLTSPVLSRPFLSLEVSMYAIISFYGHLKITFIGILSGAQSVPHIDLLLPLQSIFFFLKIYLLSLKE